LTKFHTEGNNRYTSLSAVAPIRLRLVCLGLLSPNGYGCPKSMQFRTVRVLFVKIRIKSRPSEPPSRANAGSFRPSLSSSCVSAELPYFFLAKFPFP